jgi:hypothetical protein
MHKRKQRFSLIIFVGLILLGLQCSLPIEEPSAPVTQETPAATPTLAEPGQLRKMLNNIIRAPWLLLVPLFIFTVALLLLLLLRKRLKQKKDSTDRAPSTAPLVPWDETMEMQRVPYLTLLADVEPSVTFTLEQEILTIGRGEDNDIVIDNRIPGHKTVSRNHARIYKRAGYWIIKDLQSQNGVYVNQQRTGHNILRPGYSISVGGVTFRFQTNEAEVTT